jgi:UTP--glucose-1-phosphate uridylyltransferase
MSAALSAFTDSRIVKAVLPAAGLGTRLRPLTRALPKELLPIGRLPVLAHIVRELRGAGITQALFIVSERKPQIRAYFGDEYAGDDAADQAETLPPLRCDYVCQEEQRGLGDALLHAQAWVGDDPFVVAFGDCLIETTPPQASSEPLRRLIATHLKEQAAATVLVEEVPWERVGRYGVLAPQESTVSTPTLPFAARDIVEKPTPEEAPSNLVVAARWILQPTIFAALRGAALDPRGELNLTDAVRALRQAGAPLWAVPLQAGEARRDIGNFESFFAAFVRAALRDPQAGDAARQAAEQILNVTNATDEGSRE